MSLGQINLRAEFKYQRAREFNAESWCVAELYWSKLKNLEVGNVRKCNLADHLGNVRATIKKGTTALEVVQRDDYS